MTPSPVASKMSRFRAPGSITTSPTGRVRESGVRVSCEGRGKGPSTDLPSSTRSPDSIYISDPNSLHPALTPNSPLTVVPFGARDGPLQSAQRVGALKEDDIPGGQVPTQGTQMDDLCVRIR